MRAGLFSVVVISWFIPILTSAQSLSLGSGDLLGNNVFTVSTSPQYPAPYGQVTLSFLSSTLSLANSTITVTSNGTEVYRGSVRPVSIPLKGAGSVANISVTLTSNGASYAQSVMIQPQDVVIILEPISSSPSLYPGKSFVPVEGSVRAVAVANIRDAAGKIVDPTNLSYAWSVDDAAIADSSGIGKTTILIASPLKYRDRTASVVVQTKDGSLHGGADISFSAHEPLVRLYENDPLLGIRFDRALFGTFPINGVEKTIFGAPFAFPAKSALLLQWSLNGAPAQTGSSITLKPTGDGAGSANLSLTASASGTLSATADLPVSFSTKAATNFFGL